MSKATAKMVAGRQSAITARSILDSFVQEYQHTPTQLKVLDCFSACALATALLQFVYALLVGSFPFNAFLAGFFCCIGCFVLTVSLRMQLAAGGSKTAERAFMDYTLAITVLFLAVWNYIG